MTFLPTLAGFSGHGFNASRPGCCPAIYWGGEVQFMQTEIDIERITETLSSLNSWLNASDAELRLMLGELTAQEIRTLRAVLKAIAGLPLT